MADWSDVMAATRAVVDPATSAADLAAIAGAQRGLWVQIASHPNAYPALLEWLSAQGDDAVRAAVASRQQPITPTAPVAPAAPTVVQQPIAPQPMVEQQPMMGTVTASDMAAPAPRKSLTKPLLISGAGLLVVVAIVVVALVIHSASSILRYDQLQTFVSILNGEDVGIYSPEDMEHTSDIPSSCQDTYQMVNKILGYAGFDVSGVDFMTDTQVWILADHKTALSFSDSMVKCRSDGSATMVSSQTTGDVSLSIWQIPGQEDEGEGRVAVYKNVVALTGAYDISTRGQWQSYMTTTFKSAVDRAIKS